jgi:hypothetical protein
VLNELPDVLEPCHKMGVVPLIERMPLIGQMRSTNCGVECPAHRARIFLAILEIPRHEGLKELFWSHAHRGLSYGA